MQPSGWLTAGPLNMNASPRSRVQPASPELVSQPTCPFFSQALQVPAGHSAKFTYVISQSQYIYISSGMVVILNTNATSFVMVSSKNCAKQLLYINSWQKAQSHSVQHFFLTLFSIILINVLTLLSTSQAC